MKGFEGEEVELQDSIPDTTIEKDFEDVATCQLQQAVREAVSQLDIDLQSFLHLRYWENLEPHQISYRLDSVDMRNMI